MGKVVNNLFKGIGKVVRYCFRCLEEKDGKLSFSRVFSMAIIIRYLTMGGDDILALTVINVAFPCVIYAINKAPSIIEKLALAWTDRQGGGAIG